MGDRRGSSTGRLTTHVLDTATGLPAAGLKVELHRLKDGEAALIGSIKTNADGRADAPLLSGDDMVTGSYELVFHAGDYFREQKLDLVEPFFLDQVPLRFGVADPSKHYHVPLLLSPFGYTTYRGS
ncbi:MAG: hydroxyisourate hydrolase [Geminicoccales bacterium]